MIIQLILLIIVMCIFLYGSLYCMLKGTTYEGQIRTSKDTSYMVFGVMLTMFLPGIAGMIQLMLMKL